MPNNWGAATEAPTQAAWESLVEAQAEAGMAGAAEAAGAWGWEPKKKKMLGPEREAQVPGLDLWPLWGRFVEQWKREMAAGGPGMRWNLQTKTWEPVPTPMPPEKWGVPTTPDRPVPSGWYRTPEGQYRRSPEGIWAGEPPPEGYAEKYPVITPLESHVTRWAEQFADQPSVFPEMEIIPTLEQLKAGVTVEQIRAGMTQAQKEKAWAEWLYNPDVFRTPEDRRKYIEAKALNTAIFTGKGEQISEEEARKIALRTPNLEVYKAWALGEGITIPPEPMTIREAIDMPAWTPLLEAKELASQAAVNALKQEINPILLGDASYDEKRGMLSNLMLETRYTRNIPEPILEAYRSDIENMVANTLSPAELKALSEKYPEGEKPPAPQPLSSDIVARTLSPFGVQIIKTWPFAQLTEEQLRELTPSAYQLLTKYLRDNGVSFGDAIIRETKATTQKVTPRRSPEGWRPSRQWG